MKTAIKVSCGFILLLSARSLWADAWASLYSINVAKIYQLRAPNKNTVVLGRTLHTPASQILFSWNALRPTDGYYVFYMQVRLHNADRWSGWYKMAEWGDGVQRSFEQLLPRDPSFCYVRLEAPAGDLMSEFRIKIEAHGQAVLSDVARLTVAAADYRKFSAETGTGKTFAEPTLRLKSVPAFSQMQVEHVDRERICSPTSLSMILSYLLKRHIDPSQFAQNVYDEGLGTYGSWPFNVAQAYVLTHGRYYFTVTRLNSFADIYDLLRRGLPVAVSVRGRMRTMPSGRTYADGHLLVIVGWDNALKRVIVLDPAFENKREVLHGYDIDDFLTAWERSYRLAYVAEPV